MDQFFQKLKWVSVIGGVALSGLVVSGCDNGSSKQTIASSQQAQKFKNDTIISGKITLESGSINSGEVKAKDKKGQEIASTELNNTNQFILSIPAMTPLPVTMTYYPGEKEDMQEPLYTVIIYPSIKKYDINERTTAIAKAAKKMGGYTAKNLTIAAESAIHVPDANKTSTGFRGDPTKQYGGWH